jgi:hypothetical protein
VNFEPYREQYKKNTPKKDFKYYEIYNAWRIFFDPGPQQSSDLLLMLDYGIFYEFIPMDTLEHRIKKAIRLDVEILIYYLLL